MKNFFNFLEEKIVFPYGRRVWQVMVLFTSLACAGSLAFFLINSTPTSREEVHVSKDEVVANEIDTNKVVSPTSACTLQEYQLALDTLKLLLPMAEWSRLGDSTDPYEEFASVNGEYLAVMKRGYARNDTAMPNVLDDVFRQRGFDSTDICERRDVLTILNTLLSKTNESVRWSSPIKAYVRFVLDNRNPPTPTSVSRGLSLRALIDPKAGQIANDDDLDRLNYYLLFALKHDYSIERERALSNLLSAHRALQKPVFADANYYELMGQVLIKNELDDEAVTAAINDLVKDIEFYDANDLRKTLSQYLKLYGLKIAEADVKARERESEKEANRAQMKPYFFYAVGATLLIAIILLLFSIQSLLKRHIKD